MQLTISYLCIAINTSLQQDCIPLTTNLNLFINNVDIIKFIGTLVDIYGDQFRKKKDYFKTDNTKYSERQQSKIKQYISDFNPKVLFTKFNFGLYTIIYIR